MKDCRKCKDYRDCPGKPWYHYSEIRFCPFQILWVIEYSGTLIDNWPPDPDGSSYIDQKVRTGYRSEAYYTKPVGILAEVNRRLARTGKDGEKLVDEVLKGLELSYESKLALRYVSNWWAKLMSYSDWKKQWRYRHDR